MKAPQREYILVGKIGAAYGVKGWLKIHSYLDEIADILQYNPWYLAQGSEWQAFELETGRPHGKGIVAKFEGIETPEEARLLTGREIAIKREQLAPLKSGEYYWTDLIGLTVIDHRGVTLGEISYMLETGSNDVMVIKDAQGKEHALPYLPGRVIKNIDLIAKTMTVEWDLI